MIGLAYVLAVGPAQWPVSEMVAYMILYELIVECTALWGMVIVGMCRRVK
jgi:hypothetical protein